MEKYLLKLPHYQFLTKINMPGKDKRQKAKEKKKITTELHGV
jgi:hypothetical protein